MDIQITNPKGKNGIPNKSIIYLLGFLLVCFVLIAIWLSMGEKQEWYQIETRKTAVTSLGIGKFISSGQRTLTSNVRATVVSIPRAAGDRLEVGDLMMVLESSILNNEMELAKIKLRRAEIEQKEAMLTFEQSLNEAQLEFDKSEISLKIASVELAAHRTLLKKNVVSKLRYAQIQANYDQQQSESNAVRKRQSHLQKFQIQRRKMMEELVSIEHLNVARIEEQLSHLIIKATEQVVVKEVYVAMGDSVQQGTRLALIGQEYPDGVRLRFPQQDFSQLQVGGILLLYFNGEEFSAIITRVLPDLQGGYVVIETSAEGIPENARTEMSVQGKVNTTEVSATVVAIYEPDYSLIPGKKIEILLRRKGDISTLVLSDIERSGTWLVFPSLLYEGDEIAFKSIN